MSDWQTMTIAMSGATGQGAYSTEGGIWTGLRISGDVPGTADITIYDNVGDGAAPILLKTLTNVVVPYDDVPQSPTRNELGALTGLYAYRTVGGNFIVNVAQGNAGNIKVSFMIV